MTIGIFIDSMVWDFLYDRQLDLEVELPPGEFSLCITRDAEFEIAAMPAEKKAFVEAAIARCKIPTDMFFGFAEASPIISVTYQVVTPTLGYVCERYSHHEHSRRHGFPLLGDRSQPGSA